MKGQIKVGGKAWRNFRFMVSPRKPIRKFIKNVEIKIKDALEHLYVPSQQFIRLP